MTHPIKSKTMQIALAMAILGALLPFIESAEQLPSWVLTISGAIMAVLRAITSTPLGIDPPSAEPVTGEG